MRLREWREQAGPNGTVRTREDVAQELGIYESTVARYENGNRDPDRIMKRKIFVMTDGAVQPNDFYDVPAWRRLLSVVRDRLASRAA